MTIKTFFHKINNRWIKLRLRPIRVFCFHHISKEYDMTSMCEGDWMEITHFKCKVRNMKKIGYKFISLSEAYIKMKGNILRFNKYAVLTADDGYSSLKEILPWLIEEQIPITLFVNSCYTDGYTQRVEKGKDFSYLTTEDLICFIKQSHGLISLQSHGHEHIDATKINIEKFKEQINKAFEYIQSFNISELSGLKMHAYTWGRHSADTDATLKEKDIIPVLIDGMRNYNNADYIHRELL